MKIVIIGGVAAGMSAAARLRRLDEQAQIIVLERDSHVSFANCGLPYHIGGSIPNRQQLLVATPEHLRGTLNLDVRTQHEALAIDRQQQQVTVLNRQSGQQYQESYDVLVLAQGADPLRPPVPGIDLPQVMTLRTLSDMDRIMAALSSGARNAVVIGASYIGVEMVEALCQRGLQVDLVELQEQVMPLLDPEIATALTEELTAHGVALHLGVSARAFTAHPDGLQVELSDGRVLRADLALLAVGVRPVSALARAAGLALGPRGGLAVDPQLRTSDPRIYAAGDMVEVSDTVTGEAALIALAGPANRQGRIIADAICGRPAAYRSTQGTAIVKLFGRCAASTGASEKTLRRNGRAYRKIYLHPGSHAGYYPGAQPMQIKLLFAPEDGRLLGAQIVGSEGVDKRIDVLATALRAGMSVFDLEHLELAYAPPYSSAKDPVNMAGFVAANLLRGDVAFWYAEQIDARGEALLVDVRDPQEYAQGHLAGAINLPVASLRGHAAELAALGRPIWLYCAVGLRSYSAFRILRQHGLTEVQTLAGGVRTFSATHGPRQPLQPGAAAETIADLVALAGTQPR